MQTRSRLLAIDLWCTPCNAQDFQAQVELIRHRVRESFHVVKESIHRFDPQGETWIAILSESHCAIHTYPEHHYVSIDLYSCNQARDLKLTEAQLLEGLSIFRKRSQEIERG